jgi:hypothetical protein
MSAWLKTDRMVVGVTHDRWRLASEFQGARLEMLGRLARKYLADAIGSGELLAIARVRKLSWR